MSILKQKDEAFINLLMETVLAFNVTLDHPKPFYS
jgi:hypothetical protein